MIIGKRGSTLNKIFKDTGALVTLKSGKIKIKGTTEQRELAHAAIKAELVNMVRAEKGPKMRFVFFLLLLQRRLAF